MSSADETVCQNRSINVVWSSMTALEELEKTVLALPIEQRVALAEALLGSLPTSDVLESNSDDITEVERRDLEIESGRMQPLSEGEFQLRIETSRRR